MAKCVVVEEEELKSNTDWVYYSACSRQTKWPKMFDALVIHPYGLFEIFRRRGQSQLTQFQNQLEEKGGTKGEPRLSPPL